MSKKNEIFITGLLFIAVIFSAISTVYSVHLTRKYVSELSELNRRADELQIEWERLLLEKNMLSGYSRIESIAIQKIGMQAPEKNQIEVMQLN